jgi:hypothetical protein
MSKTEVDLAPAEQSDLSTDYEEDEIIDHDRVAPGENSYFSQPNSNCFADVVRFSDDMDFETVKSCTIHALILNTVRYRVTELFLESATYPELSFQHDDGKLHCKWHTLMNRRTQECELIVPKGGTSRGLAQRPRLILLKGVNPGSLITWGFPSTCFSQHAKTQSHLQHTSQIISG